MPESPAGMSLEIDLLTAQRRPRPRYYYRSRVKNWCRAFAFVPVVWKLSNNSVTCSVKSRQRMGISKS